jgi:hypothetical protein
LASNAVKVEGSIFTGREPDENRYDFDTMRFDSYSGRLTVNPTRDVSAQLSHGFLKSPEAVEPDANQQRTTASGTYNLPAGGGAANWQTTAGWARNRIYEPAEPVRATDAWLLESAYLAPDYTVFGRFERVDKDELFPDDPEAGLQKDRIERRPMEYHEKVRQNYLAQAKADPQRYRVVDAGRPPQVVHEDVWRVLEGLQ